MTKTPSRPPISIPLPLPAHFALLPTRIPGQTLAPVLYSLINDIPVYLTLSPSHQPHLSLLPLLLSLKPPVPPLHILTAFRLAGGDYSVDLDGTAPFVDLWVPYAVARRICEKLGVDKLFWDKWDDGKGLLSEKVKDAVSWDEGGHLGHNWIPPSAQLPPSSYSLATLLETPFSGISIIPNDRCISTPIDPGRRANIISSAESKDHSRIRNGKWAQSWESLIKWTILVWEEYLRYPSKPPKDRPVSFLAPSDLPSIVHQLIPSLSSSASTLSTFAPALRDLQTLLDPDTSPRPRLSFRPFEELLHAGRCLVAPYVPFISGPKTDLSPEEITQRQTRARVSMGIVEQLSITLMETWKTEQECRRLEKILDGRDMPAQIVLECRALDTDPDETTERKGGVENGKKGQTTPMSTRTHTNGVKNTKEPKLLKRVDSMEELRRRRGGSPVSSVGSDTPPLEVDKPPTWPAPPFPPRSDHTDLAQSNRSHTTPRESGLKPRPSSQTACGSATRDRCRKLDDPASAMSDALQAGAEVAIQAVNDEVEMLRQIRLTSENGEGWWMYVSVIGMAVIALLMGI